MRYSPWADLESRAHLTFGVTRLPWGEAWWMRDIQSITLDDRLQRLRRDWRLAHELVHDDFNDDSCALVGPDGKRLARRIETRCDRVAAERLIHFDDLYEALRRHPFDPAMVATHLDRDVDALKVRLKNMSREDKELMEKRLVVVGAIRSDNH
jgi:Zn-dependent peptidase ImmA (M78 family)